jgi:hypothetical protein
MKKESFSPLPLFSGSLLLAGLLSLLVAASASTQSASVTGRDHSPPMQQQPVALQSQETKEPDTVETRLTELFELCRNDRQDEAAAYFVYRGPDKKREWKDTLRASDPVEKAAAGEICRRIKNYLDESQYYRFGEVKVERESEGEWHALEVSFEKDAQTKKATFAFLLVKGRYAIGDIDD